MERIDVTIIDSRSDWMRKEDAFALCWLRCPLFKKCQSRFGDDCNRNGGDEIPKMKG